jgi:hypothetical protein
MESLQNYSWICYEWNGSIAFYLPLQEWKIKDLNLIIFGAC